MYAKVNRSFKPSTIAVQFATEFPLLWHRFASMYYHELPKIEQMCCKPELVERLGCADPATIAAGTDMLTKITVKQGLLFLSDFLSGAYVVEQLHRHPVVLGVTAGQMLQEMSLKTAAEEECIQKLLSWYVIRSSQNCVELGGKWDGWDENQFRVAALETLLQMRLDKDDHNFVYREIDTYCESAHVRSAV